jgi:Gas vesicle protein G
MLLVDDFLMLPFSGFGFVLRTLQKVAEEQYADDAPVKERLLELQLRLESGEISEIQYVREETAIVRELREIEKRKRALVGAPAAEHDRGLAFTGKTEATASVTFYQDSERKS